MKKLRSFVNAHNFEIFAFGAIFALVFAVYYHSVKFHFTYFDDAAIILSRIDEMDTFSKVKDFLIKPVYNEVSNVYYRPLLNFSFALDTIISGGDTGYYHHTNVLIHALAAFLVFIFLSMLGYKKICSLCLSLIFAVHPALMSAAVWVPGRNDTILAVFTLLSLICFIKSLENKKTLSSILAAFFFFCAMLTKETAIIIPVIYVLLPLLYDIKTDRRTAVKTALFVIIVLAVYAVLRTITISQGSSSIKSVGVIGNIFNSLYTMVWYTGIIFMLEKLYIFPNIVIKAFDIFKGFIPVAVFGAFTFIFRKKINFKHVLFGILIYVLFLLPTLSVDHATYLNHRLYIPIIGIFIVILEVFILPLFAKFPNSAKAFYVIVPLILIIFSVMSHKMSYYYQDRETFWKRAYQEYPLSENINMSLGRYYISINELDKAEEHTRKAIEIVGNKRSIYLQLGEIFMRRNEFDKAYQCFETARPANLYNEYYYFFLSNFYERKKDNENAVRIIEEGLKYIPKSKILRSRLEVLKSGDKRVYSTMTIQI